MNPLFFSGIEAVVEHNCGSAIAFPLQMAVCCAKPPPAIERDCTAQRNDPPDSPNPILFLLLLLLCPLMTRPVALFDHEKLVAYHRSIQFVAWSSDLLESIPTKFSVSDQLDRASTSVPLNIAEGNGKYTPPDRCCYFEIARGSALECAACLDVLVAKGKCTTDQVQSGKALLHEVVSVLIGLIKSLSPDRLGEDPLPYRASEGKQEQELWFSLNFFQQTGRN